MTFFSFNYHTGQQGNATAAALQGLMGQMGQQGSLEQQLAAQLLLQQQAAQLMLAQQVRNTITACPCTDQSEWVILILLPRSRAMI